MNNDNIIDFVLYQEKCPASAKQNPMLSEDLRVAIEILIQRLRNHEPVEQAG
jgi:hypothetical protein